jgi:GTP cyclohydrolase II
MPSRTRAWDTVEANLALGFKADQRDYGVWAQILADLGIKNMRLMTNNPKKITGLSAYGLKIVEQLRSPPSRTPTTSVLRPAEENGPPSFYHGR